MSQLFSLSAEQLERIKPFFPLSHGISRVDDLKVISGIIYVIKHGLQWKEDEALEWSKRRGARSGRVAWQFVTELAGRAGKAL